MASHRNRFRTSIYLGCLVLVGGIVGIFLLMSGRHQHQPVDQIVAKARSPGRFQSEYLYEVAFEGLPWRMMTPEQTGQVLGSRVEEADLRLIREDGSAFALFFPLSFNNTPFSRALGAELEQEIEEKWLNDLHSWQSTSLEQGFLLTAQGQVEQTSLTYAIFYKHFGNFGLYGVFWSEAERGEQLIVDANQMYAQVSAPPLKERLPQLSAADVYDRNSNAVVLINVYDEDGELLGRGSGFNLAPEGLIVTNFHVLTHGESIEVVFPKDGRYQEVFIVGISAADADLALLSLDATALPTVRAVRTVPVVPGDIVYAIGNPRGLVNSVSEGIVGGIREEREMTLYQITAPISQGSSGGPVFNVYGEVIGIAHALIEDAQNLNFSVSIDELRRLFLLPQPLSLEQFHSILEENSRND